MFDVSKQWFYANGETREGPVSGETVIVLIKEGQIVKTTKLWTDGLPFWIVAGEVDGLFVAEPPPINTIDGEKKERIKTSERQYKYILLLAAVAYLITQLIVARHISDDIYRMIYLSIISIFILTSYLFFINKQNRNIFFIPNTYIISTTSIIGVLLSAIGAYSYNPIWRLLSYNFLVASGVIVGWWLYITIKTVPAERRNLSPFAGLFLFFTPIINIIGVFIVIKKIKCMYYEIPTSPRVNYGISFVGCCFVVLNSAIYMISRIAYYNNPYFGKDYMGAIGSSIYEINYINITLFIAVPLFSTIVWLLAWNEIYKQVRWLQARLPS